MKQRTVIVTGAIGMAGGLATAATVSSCDMVCGEEVNPSVVVRFVAPSGSLLEPVMASNVRYSKLSGEPADSDDLHDTLITDPATIMLHCADTTCTEFNVGLEEPGMFRVEGEYCGKTYSAVASVPLGEDGCVDTQHLNIQVDPGDCIEDPDDMRTPPPDPQCDLMARPSVVVYVAKRYDDYFAPAPVESLRWSLEKATPRQKLGGPAYCLEDYPGDRCAVWAAGWEVEGRISVSTEYCDVEIGEIVEVPMTEDGCHVDTRFVTLNVETRGCLATEEPAQPPPRPGGPDSMVAPAGGHPDGPTDVTAPARQPPTPPIEDVDGG